MGYRGTITAGAWAWAPGERDRWTAKLRGLRDGVYEMPLPVKPTRSQKANAYYWSTVLPPIAEHTGHTCDEVHDVMCQQFIPNELRRIEFYNRMTGEVAQHTIDTRRSSKLTGGPFFDFVENVRQWAREFLQVDTPDPNPEYWRRKEAA